MALSEHNQRSLVTAVQNQNAKGLAELLAQQIETVRIREEQADAAARAHDQCRTALQVARDDFDRIRQHLVDLIPELATGYAHTETVGFGPDGGIHVVSG